MNLYALPNLVALIINYTLSIIIYSDIKKTKSRLAYLLYILAISFFQLFEFLNLSTVDININLILLKLQSLAWLIAPLLFLNFVYTLFFHQSFPRFRILLTLLIPIGSISIFSNKIILTVKEYTWGNDIIAGSLFIPTIFLTFILPILISLILLLKVRFTKNQTKLNKYHSSYILGSTLITVCMILCFDIVLPHILKIDSMYRLSSCMLSLQTTIIFLAIYIHSLLEVKIENAIGYIFRHSSNSIIILNPDHTIRYANHAARQLLSGNNETFFGNNLSKILVNDDEYDINANYKNKKTLIGNKNSLKTYLISQIEVRDWLKANGKIVVIKPTRREIS